MKEDSQNSAVKTRRDILDALILEFSQQGDGLADRTLTHFLGEILSQIAERERELFLKDHGEDKGNGFYSRNLSLGSIPMKLSVPRVRFSDFRPAILPDKHQRAFPEEQRQILFSLLASSRSKTAAKEAMARLHLPYSEAQVEAVVTEVVENFSLKSTSPLDPDLLALFMDAKHKRSERGMC